jgi:hypothetical protein
LAAAADILAAAEVIGDRTAFLRAGASYPSRSVGGDKMAGYAALIRPCNSETDYRCDVPKGMACRKEWPAERNGLPKGMACRKEWPAERNGLPKGMACRGDCHRAAR